MTSRALLPGAWAGAWAALAAHGTLALPAPAAAGLAVLAAGVAAALAPGGRL